MIPFKKLVYFFKVEILEFRFCWIISFWSIKNLFTSFLTRGLNFLKQLLSVFYKPTPVIFLLTQQQKLRYYKMSKFYVILIDINWYELLFCAGWLIVQLCQNVRKSWCTCPQRGGCCKNVNSKCTFGNWKCQFSNGAVRLQKAIRR